MTHDELLAAVIYFPETGEFIRRKSAGNVLAGASIGHTATKGYRTASVLSQYVKLHRLAWFYVNGTWPTDQIDHINGVKDDNRIANLRVCSTSTNCTNQHGPRTNNKVGFQGVHRITKTGRYRAACMLNGNKHHLGVFATAEEAFAAYTAFKAPHLPERKP